MNYSKNIQAFTLIEVLVSITLLSIILTIFLPFFANSISLSSKTEDKLTAINLAEKELESVISSTKIASTSSCSEVPITKQLGDKTNNKNYYSTIKFICKEEVLNLIPMKLSISRDKNGNNPITVLYGYVERSTN